MRRRALFLVLVLIGAYSTMWLEPALATNPEPEMMVGEVKAFAFSVDLDADGVADDHACQLTTCLDGGWEKAADDDFATNGDQCDVGSTLEWVTSASSDPCSRWVEGDQFITINPDRTGQCCDVGIKRDFRADEGQVYQATATMTVIQDQFVGAGDSTEAVGDFYARLTIMESNSNNANLGECNALLNPSTKASPAQQKVTVIYRLNDVGTTRVWIKARASVSNGTASGLVILHDLTFKRLPDGVGDENCQPI